jgi:hypothetical protein
MTKNAGFYSFFATEDISVMDSSAGTLLGPLISNVTGILLFQFDMRRSCRVA